MAESEPNVAEQDSKPHPWVDLPAEQFRLLRLAALPTDGNTGVRPLRFVQLGRVERHSAEQSLLRLSIQVPGVALRRSLTPSRKRHAESELRPASSPDTTMAAAAAIAERQSSDSASKPPGTRLMTFGGTSARTAPDSTTASDTPASPPAAARTRLSVRSCRTIRPRPAPIARRMASSRRRTLVRATRTRARPRSSSRSTRPPTSSCAGSGSTRRSSATRRPRRPRT